MNILFMTLVHFTSLRERNIYTDLLREFVKHGHNVYAITPVERRQNQATMLIEEENAVILRLRIGNTQQTNIVEKGISTMLIEHTYKDAIKRYFADVKFELVLYSTPPITLLSAVEFVKRRDSAKTYLLLKDIFPQNAIDIGLLRESGIKGILYRYFRRKEKKLYAISDHIGCMSQANVDYIIRHNPEIDPAKVEICPNAMEVVDKSVDENIRAAIRVKYGIPQDKTVFVYGGNLGKPQGIPFLIDCLKECREIKDAFFLIVGDGTEYHLLHDYVETDKPSHVKLMQRLPKEDFDTMVAACDVGLIFLDHRFTIPNFPSRLLAYMQAKLPVLACTDPNTDIGKVVTADGFGWWCESVDAEKFKAVVQRIKEASLADMGERAFTYLQKHYSVNESYKTIMNSIGMT